MTKGKMPTVSRKKKYRLRRRTGDVTESLLLQEKERT